MANLPRALRIYRLKNYFILINSLNLERNSFRLKKAPYQNISKGIIVIKFKFKINFIYLYIH